MALAVLTGVFDFFDFYIVGFLVAVLATAVATSPSARPPVILLSAGVGAIVGCARLGRLVRPLGPQDAAGRRRRNLCAVGAGSRVADPRRRLGSSSPRCAS